MNHEDSEFEASDSEAINNADNENQEGFGDDFDEFEAGATDEDFGDFNDEEFEKPPSPKTHRIEPASSDQALISPFVSRFVVRIDVHLVLQAFVALLCKPS